MEDIRKKLHTELQRLGIPSAEKSARKLEFFFNYLLEEKKKTNLIGAIGDEKILDYLFLDSLLFLEHFNPPLSSKIVDVGSGAGFPGMIIKIARPDISLSFLDSALKKLHFIEKVCSMLELDGVDFINRRAEEAGRDPVFREAFDFVVSRGVAALPVLLELCAPLAKPGGRVVTWKGNKLGEEISALGSGYLLLGMSAPEVVEINRPGIDWTTCLVSFSREKSTPEKFPRSFQSMRRKDIGFLVNNSKTKS